MEKEVFAPIVNDVIDLVREQIRMVRERARTTGGNVTAVLLVGGFGSSEYLKNRIKASIDRAIIVQQPANGWTAVVRGAAMIGLSRANSELGRVHVSERVARKHYGTELNKVFVEGEDDASKKFAQSFVPGRTQLTFPGSGMRKRSAI
jgi:molecular chaperone DnaK (HSP70)